jgi:HSP20 family protein
MFPVPFNRSTELARNFERLFDEGFDRFFGLAPAAEGAARTPALDLTENPTTYTVKLDLPGVAKEDVHVAVEGRRVDISAQTRREDEKKEGDRVVYRERSVQSFARSFTLPQEVDSGKTVAKLDQGVLTLTLPKSTTRSPSRVEVS